MHDQAQETASGRSRSEKRDGARVRGQRGSGPDGAPGPGDDDDDGFLDSDDPWSADHHHRLLRRGLGRTTGGDRSTDNTSLKLPEKFPFPKLPNNAAGIAK